MTTLVAGSVARALVTFTPDSGSSAIENVTCQVEDSDGNETAPTVITDGAESYYADFTIADTAGSGRWSVRWECSDPVMVVETTFDVTASRLYSP